MDKKEQMAARYLALSDELKEFVADVSNKEGEQPLTLQEIINSWFMLKIITLENKINDGK